MAERFRVGDRPRHEIGGQAPTPTNTGPELAPEPQPTEPAPEKAPGDWESWATGNMEVAPEFDAVGEFDRVTGGRYAAEEAPPEEATPYQDPARARLQDYVRGRYVDRYPIREKRPDAAFGGLARAQERSRLDREARARMQEEDATRDPNQQWPTE